ncbi:MAG: hypothetical protein ABJF23_27950 [Bryobacteraceae bacterium]
MKPYWIPILFAGVATAFGQQVTTVNVPANQVWTKTGVYLNPGSTVLIEARGAIEAVSAADTRALFHKVPPAGRPERQSNKPQPEMPALVLLAKIGNGPVLEAGARAEFQAGGRNGSGELLLGINDNYVADNTGSWTAQVTVTNGGSNISQQQGNDRRSQENANQNDRYAIDRNRNERDQNGTYQSNRSRGDSSSRRYNNREAQSALDNKAQDLGRNFLGDPMGDVRTTADGVGLYREYRNGGIYWSADTGAHAVLSQIREEWLNRGAETGELGYPISDDAIDRDGTNRIVRFQRGTITWNDRTGARVSRR